MKNRIYKLFIRVASKISDKILEGHSLNILYERLASDLNAMIASQIDAVGIDDEDFKLIVTDAYHHGEITELFDLVYFGTHDIAFHLNVDIERYSPKKGDENLSLKVPGEYLNKVYADYFQPKKEEVKAGGFTDIQEVVYFRAYQEMMRNLLEKVCRSVEVTLNDKGVEFYESTPSEIKDAISAYLDDINLVAVAFEA